MLARFIGGPVDGREEVFERGYERLHGVVLFLFTGMQK